MFKETQTIYKIKTYGCNSYLSAEMTFSTQTRSINLSKTDYLKMSNYRVNYSFLPYEISFDCLLAQ